MSYFDDVAKSSFISEADKEKLGEIIVDKNNHVEVSRAIEYYFCFVKTGCVEEELEVLA